MQEWNSHYFQHTTLQALGMELQLGHPIGEECLSPAYGPRACVVLHTNGLHPVTIKYCQCNQLSRAGDRTEQLLRTELYPATLTSPTTFCTIRMLEHFHLQTLQSKITAYDYYKSLEKLSDVARLGLPYVSTQISALLFSINMKR